MIHQLKTEIAHMSTTFSPSVNDIQAARGKKQNKKKTSAPDFL